MRRFKSQILLSQNAIIAAMAYVDLNPVRAKMVGSLVKSKNTGIKLRIKKIAKNQPLAHELLAPIAGLTTFQLPKLSAAEYIEFVDQTGRIMHPGKRGMIGAHEPPALRKLGLDMRHWTMQVKGIGSGYWRAVGTAEELMEKAAAIPRTWLCGVGFARFFNG